MSDAAPERQDQATRQSPVVASVLSSDRVVINKGQKDGIDVGQRFLIYAPTDEEIMDPITNESLGFLEEPKGTGRIVSVQERIAMLESDAEPKRDPGAFPTVGTVIDMFTPAAKGPFRNALVGDWVKRLY